MIVRTQRTISEITFQMWDISIPDVGYIQYLMLKKINRR